MDIGILRFDEPERDTSRKIIHVDMDAFYASVEMREDPSLKDKPVIIARHPKETGGKGVVATANYEARKYGIHSAMSSQKAYELCPNAVFVSGNFDLYREVSAQVREIFKRYTDLIEPLSLDEAYLDVTKNKMNMKSATVIAKRIQREVWDEVHLTCSAGVSYNKFIAKLASDYQKPAGITVIPPEKASAFLLDLPIEKFYGVGKKTVERMHELNVFTGKDLYQMDQMTLIHHFGRMGFSLYRKVRGIDDGPVRASRERKSIGKENTYNHVLQTDNEVIAELRHLSKRVYQTLIKHQKHGKTVVLKIRYADFETITKRMTLPDYLSNENDVFFYVQNMWYEIGKIEKEVRLLGVTVTNLDPIAFENIILPLWDEKVE